MECDSTVLSTRKVANFPFNILKEVKKAFEGTELHLYYINNIIIFYKIKRKDIHFLFSLSLPHQIQLHKITTTIVSGKFIL